tara:strand:+ start:881 stop:1015 length:135 start_codon:yes stop_codon:yes gene_type:complete
MSIRGIDIEELGYVIQKGLLQVSISIDNLTKQLQEMEKGDDTNE